MSDHAFPAKLRIMNSFAAMIRQMAFDRISVNELIEAANVSRTTFYRLFEDKYDLLRQTVFWEFEPVFATNCAVGTEKKALNLFFETFAQQKTILSQYRRFETELLTEMIFDVCRSMYYRRIENLRGREASTPEAMSVRVTAAGATQAILDWMRNGFSLPVEECVQLALANVPELLRDTAQITEQARFPATATDDEARWSMLSYRRRRYSPTPDTKGHDHM